MWPKEPSRGVLSIILRFATAAVTPGMDCEKSAGFHRTSGPGQKQFDRTRPRRASARDVCLQSIGPDHPTEFKIGDIVAYNRCIHEAKGLRPRISGQHLFEVCRGAVIGGADDHGDDFAGD
jgi:hypothetical protein